MVFPSPSVTFTSPSSFNVTELSGDGSSFSGGLESTFTVPSFRFCSSSFSLSNLLGWGFDSGFLGCGLLGCSIFFGSGFLMGFGLSCTLGSSTMGSSTISSLFFLSLSGVEGCSLSSFFFSSSSLRFYSNLSISIFISIGWRGVKLCLLSFASRQFSMRKHFIV